MTGLTVAPFQTRSTRLTPLWAQAERLRLSQRQRQHAIGHGTQDTLATLQDKLRRLRGCDRFALTDERLSWRVGLDASNVCRLQQRLDPLLAQAATPHLGLSLRRRLPPGVKKIGTWEALLAVWPDFAEVVTDATEPPRQWPLRRSQRCWYSGKRKRHTVKTPVTVSRQGRSRPVSDSVPGRVPDDPRFKRSRLAERLPPTAPLARDRGDDGATTDAPTLAIALPMKRRRNHQVWTRAERACHRLQAR